MCVFMVGGGGWAGGWGVGTGLCGLGEWVVVVLGGGQRGAGQVGGGGRSGTRRLGHGSVLHRQWDSIGWVGNGLAVGGQCILIGQTQSSSYTAMCRRCHGCR